MTPGVKGATKRARPVALVTRWSPLEKFMDTPGVRRPLTSSTARVAVSPVTTRRGSKRMRAEEAGGGCCGKRAKGTANERAVHRDKEYREDMASEIVDEKRLEGC